LDPTWYSSDKTPGPNCTHTINKIQKAAKNISGAAFLHPPLQRRKEGRKKKKEESILKKEYN